MQFVSQNPEALDSMAAHFGVSSDAYAMSMPSAGIVGVEIAHSGLAIAMADRQAYRAVSAKVLFNGVFDGPEYANEGQAQGTGSEGYQIPDHVHDFCKSKNLSPITVVRVGSNLLQYAALAGVALNSDRGVYKDRTLDRRGSLDSVLNFTLSPINTVLVERRPPTRLERIKRREITI